MEVSGWKLFREEGFNGIRGGQQAKEYQKKAELFWQETKLFENFINYLEDKKKIERKLLQESVNLLGESKFIQITNGPLIAEAEGLGIEKPKYYKCLEGLDYLLMGCEAYDYIADLDAPEKFVEIYKEIAEPTVERGLILIEESGADIERVKIGIETAWEGQKLDIKLKTRKKKATEEEMKEVYFKKIGSPAGTSANAMAFRTPYTPIFENWAVYTALVLQDIDDFQDWNRSGVIPIPSFLQLYTEKTGSYITAANECMSLGLSYAKLARDNATKLENIRTKPLFEFLTWYAEIWLKDEYNKFIASPPKIENVLSILSYPEVVV